MYFQSLLQLVEIVSLSVLHVTYHSKYLHALTTITANSHTKQKTKKRLSIFSVLHPALHAAFSERSAEWMSGERSATPMPLSALSDLSSAEYRSAPLRGTEARDRKGLGKQIPMTSPHESTRNNIRPDSNIDVQPDPRDALYRPQHRDNIPPKARPPLRLVQKNPPMPSPVSRERKPSSSEHINTASHIASTKLSKNGALHNVEVSREGESVSKRTGIDDKRHVLVEESVDYKAGFPDRSRVQVDARTKSSEAFDEKSPREEVDKAKLNVAVDSLGNVWTQLVATVRRTLDKVKVPVSPSATPDQESVGTYSSEYYTERDVTNLINDIMHEIQIHRDEIRAHTDMLKDTGRWDPDDLTQRERDAGVVAPMLVMRTSTLVSPDVLADAVTASTKKLLLSRATPVPWSVTSRLLMDLHSRLSEIIEPVEVVADVGERIKAQDGRRNVIRTALEGYEPVRSKSRNQKSKQSSSQTESTSRSGIYPIHSAPHVEHSDTDSAISSRLHGSGTILEPAAGSKR